MDMIQSDSRLIPADPWDSQGLLAALGPGRGNPESYSEHPPKPAIAPLPQPLGVPKQAAEFMLPSDRGKVTASQLMNVGSAAAGMEQSLTSDSMLMYLGARTPVPGANSAGGGRLQDMQ